jgi:exopolysaccharide biosynthesis polyprenyl glycosylphosphotransferase
MLVDPIIGYKYIGSLADEKPSEVTFYMEDKLKILGTVADFHRIQQQYQIEAVFLALPKLDSQDILNIATYCDQNGLSFQTVPNLFELMASSVNIADLDGIPLLSFKESPITPVQGTLKRMFDIIIASFSIIILSPLFLLLYLAVRLTSPGPAIYKQVRTGLDGKPFDFYKFRSMRIDAEKLSGPVHAQDKNDPRVTPIGKFLRHSSLDELPQLFNVLKGDMSLVGPRPERPYFVDKFSEEIPNFMARHKIRGGITGWAQVNGRAELTLRPEEKLRYDLYYIENWTLMLDIKIIIKTFVQVFQRKHVY